MSLFYNHRFSLRFPVPLLAFERLSHLSTEDPVASIVSVLQEVCGVQQPDEDDINYFLSRHQAQVAEKNKPAEGKPERQRLTRGTFFRKFLGRQDSATLLLMACGWDYVKAAHWYNHADVEAAEKVISTFLELQSETNGYLYEAVLYGFGGGYKDSAVDEEIDGTELSAADIMAMQF